MVNAGHIDVSIGLRTRKALFTPHKYVAEDYGLSMTEPTEVNVFGLFQIMGDGEADANFVIELPDGRCIYADVMRIQFIKEKDGDCE